MDSERWCESGVMRQRRQKPGQRIDGRHVGNAINPFGAKMSLKRLDHALRMLAEFAGDLDAIPIKRQHGLQRLDRLATVTALEKPPA